MEVESSKETCRACLSTNAELFINMSNAMVNMPEEISYLECFHMCTLLGNSPDLPQTLCCVCTLELEATYLFIKKCKETDVALRVKQENLRENNSKFEWIEVENNQTALQKDSDLNIDDLDVAVHLKHEFIKENSSHVKWVEVEEPQQKLEPVKRTRENTSIRVRGKDISKKLVREKQRLAGEEDEMTTCKLCQKSYPKKTISVHISRVHKSRSFLCDACPNSFKQMSALERHKRTHEPNRPRNFACEICERKFLSKGILRNHLKTHDKNRKPNFACDQCAKSFFYRYALTLHKKIHTGDSIQCQECQKTFLRPIDLKVHMRTHTGDKPYQCDRCEKSFANVCHLNKHILSHEGYGYKCDECGKEYKNQGSLTEHVRTHRGEEPYKCAICVKVFRNKYHTRLHIQKSHDIHIQEEIEGQIIKIETPRTYRTRIPMHKDGKYVYPI